ERFLGRVECVVGIAEDAPAHAVHEVRVAAQQLFDRGAITARGRACERVVVLFVAAHRATASTATRARARAPSRAFDPGDADHGRAGVAADDRADRAHDALGVGDEGFEHFAELLEVAGAALEHRDRLDLAGGDAIDDEAQRLRPRTHLAGFFDGAVLHRD